MSSDQHGSICSQIAAGIPLETMIRQVFSRILSESISLSIAGDLLGIFIAHHAQYPVPPSF